MIIHLTTSRAYGLLSWLGSMFRNVTFIPLSDDEVKDIQRMLDEKVDDV